MKNTATKSKKTVIAFSNEERVEKLLQDLTVDPIYESIRICGVEANHSNVELERTAA